MNPYHPLESFRARLRRQQDASAEALSALVKYFTETHESERSIVQERIAQKQKQIRKVELGIRSMTQNLDETKAQLTGLKRVYDDKKEIHASLESNLDICLKEFQDLSADLEETKKSIRMLNDTIPRDTAIFNSLLGLELCNTDTDEFHIKLKSLSQHAQSADLTLICRKAMSGQILNLILEQSDPRIENIETICELVNSKTISWLQCLALCRRMYKISYGN